jgi:NADH-quinone oxidoreductase subunit J
MLIAAIEIFGRQLFGGAGIVDILVFLVGALICLIGASGVVISPNPVHSALSLVVTLFGIAVLFVTMQADFLAVVQIIVYAGAIVVLFLFVIMLLGVDTSEIVDAEDRVNPVYVSVGIGIGFIAELTLLSRLTFTVATAREASGSITPVRPGVDNVRQLAEVVFTRYLFAFEITSVLLVIAVIGAVVLARRPGDAPGFINDPAAEREVEAAR